MLNLLRNMRKKCNCCENNLPYKYNPKSMIRSYLSIVRVGSGDDAGTT